MTVLAPRATVVAGSATSPFEGVGTPDAGKSRSMDPSPPQPNGVARAFWNDVKAGILPEADGDGDRRRSRHHRSRESKLRRRITRHDTFHRP